MSQASGSAAVLVTPHFPPEVDGVGDYSYWLGTALNAAGIPCQVLTSAIRTETAHPAPGRPLRRVVRAPLRWTPRGILEAARHAISHTARDGAVILQYVPHLYARRGVNPGLVLLPLLVRRAERRFMLTCHELWLGVSRWTVPLAALAAAQRCQTSLLAALSDGVVVTTPRYRRALLSAVPGSARKTHLVPVGSNIPVAPMARDERIRHRREVLPGHPFVVATFGRLHPWQDPGALLEALAALHAGGRRVGLLLVGDGPSFNPDLHRALQWQAAQLGIARSTHWTGPVPPDDVSRFLTLADAFCATGPISSRSGSVMAAMSHALPVLGTSTEWGDTSFRHGETVWLAPCARPAELAAGIARLMDDQPLRESLGRRAQALYAQTFDWPRVAERYGTLLSQQGVRW